MSMMTLRTCRLPIAAAALAALLACAAAPAHDWTSPATPRTAPERRPLAQDDPVAQPWAGLLWHGPRDGAPADPSATHCQTPPRSFEVPGPAGWERRHAHPMPAEHSSERAAASDKVAETRRDARAAGPSGLMTATPAPMAPGMAATTVAQPPRPEAEAVSAGMVDDNADFEAYQAFRERWRGVPRRDLLVRDRVLLDVRDGAGRPVPDAKVEVFQHGRAMPLWARTDAGGRAWLMPQADTPGRDFEVRISKEGRQTAVAWKRGQRDALQARLDGVAPERARLDIVFAIDATGSMGDEIDKLKRSMRAVADDIARLPSRPDLCFGLVAYRDRGDAFFVRGADLTHDLAAFQAALARLQAGGGGDYPEAMNEALHTAVHRIAWRGEGTARIVILLADAPPQLNYGAPHYDDDLRGALARGIKIFGVGASGLDRQGELVMRQMAQATGGRFVFLTYDDARNPASGPGRETVHDVRNYSVETLDKLLVRLVGEEMARWPG
jgi:Mg-chelatase subunit ChlD